MISEIDCLQADGFGCPMAHANRNDDSLQDLPPLLAVESLKKITDPIVSPRAFVHLGAFTGEEMAVCVYDSPIHPALVAYDYEDGTVLWTSPPEDLPGLFQRWPSGILLAKVKVKERTPAHYVFAANPVEFVAYAADGTRLWKRRSTEITEAAPDGVGLPTSLSYTDSRELVCATTAGWIVKLDPLDGRTIDAYKMETTVCVEGTLYRGTLASTKSPVVVGNVMYLLVDFKVNPSWPPLNPLVSPVFLVRAELSQPGVAGKENRIKPLASSVDAGAPTADCLCVGTFKGTASPPARVAPDGKVLLFAHAHAMRYGQLQPSITAVEDDSGVLRTSWRSILDVPWGDDIYAAPALHADSQNLLVTTLNNIYLFRNVGGLAGTIPPPQALPANQMVSIASDPRVESVKAGSPFGLAFNPDANELVAYTNFRIKPRQGSLSYGFLGAFAFPAWGGGPARPLWNRPLAITPQGGLIPGLGTFGQPALFRYHQGAAHATGLIVNTVFTGTFILK